MITITKTLLTGFATSMASLIIFLAFGKEHPRVGLIRVLLFGGLAIIQTGLLVVFAVNALRSAASMTQAWTDIAIAFVGLAFTVLLAWLKKLSPDSNQDD